MICDSPLFASVGVGSRYPLIRERMIVSCKTFFADADLVIGNFETVVHEPVKKSLRQMQMACPASVVHDLKEMGFSVLNLANNHCLQHGTKGFEQTRRACEDAGIHPIGVRNEEPLIMEIRGRRLAFLSLCIHLEWYQPEDIRYEDDIARILESVRALRAEDEALTIIVSVHWGDEYAMYPSQAQIALGHRLADLGANVILGHHPHVFQGIETYRDALILYSQGNFISDMAAASCRETAVTRIEIGTDGIIFRMEPVIIGDDYLPVRSDGAWYAQREKALDEALENKTDDDRYWRDISRNHAAGHDAFKKFFLRNLFRYRCTVSVKMICEFVVRKLKRMAGTSTDGRVSSMDPAIMEVLGRYHV